MITAAVAFAAAAQTAAENKTMIKIMMAVAAFALVAGNAQAFDVTKVSYPGATLEWDATFQLWTQKAKEAGYRYAYYLNVHPDDSDPMGVWSSNPHTVAAIAKDLGITTDGLAHALVEEGNWYRSEVLYFEQLTLISACLANINDKPHFRSIKAELEDSYLQQPPPDEQVSGIQEARQKSERVE